SLHDALPILHSLMHDHPCSPAEQHGYHGFVWPPAGTSPGIAAGLQRPPCFFRPRMANELLFPAPARRELGEASWLEHHPGFAAGDEPELLARLQGELPWVQ